MSIEQKAKAYDEALERARLLKLANPDDEAIQTFVKDSFPELKESEDERIRKAIMGLTYIDGIEPILIKYSVTAQDIRKYLEKQKINTEGDFGRGYDCGYKACLNSHGAEFFEKQKEQKPIPPFDELTPEEKMNHPLWLEGFDVGRAVQRVFEEQKPAEWSEEEKDKLNSIERLIISANARNYLIGDKEAAELQHFIRSIVKPTTNLAEWSEDFEENIRSLLHDKLTGHSEDGAMTWTTFIDDKTLRDIVNGIWFYVGKEALKYPDKELNVAEWSEEDKFKLEDAITGIDVGIGFYETEGKHPNLLKAIIEAKEWLKSLRPQPKPEWSEEDEEMFDEALAGVLLARNRMNDTGCIGLAERFEKAYKWLESFRPRPHWKPSEEQIAALKEVINQDLNVCCGDREWVTESLEDLLDDLKKL